MNNQDNDKTVRKESVPPMSSGTHEQGGPLLETGMMQPPQTPGTLGMIGKYQVVRILGEGGMGQVLLAREPVTDSLVAVKIIKPEFLKKEWAVHRFLTEARHMFKMSHPSIIRVHEVSDRPEGPFFVMPYMAGGSLAQKIKPGEALPSDTIQPLARQVAEALQYAHGRGIIHRDLKTSNILLDPEGRAYLCDFGLLRTVFNDSMVDVTKPQVEGTVPYMSPAIAGGKAEDTRCDIYAFGCLLYEMLTGQPPYQGPTVDAILKQIQAGPPQPIRQLNPTAPARLVAIAEHAMGRELRDRYSTMADVINDLDRAAQGKDPLGPHGRANGSHLPKRVLAALAIVALTGVAAFGLSKLPGLLSGSATATPEDQFTWTNNNGAVTITKYTGPGGAVSIPSRINGLRVTSIGYRAFRDCFKLTSVTIPNCVISIEGDTFYNCTNLAQVTIGSSVTSIGESAFAHCSSLASITIPNSVTSMGNWPFWDCGNLTRATIPPSVTAIGKSPFCSCRRLMSISVGAGNPAYSSSADGVLFNKDKTCLVNYPGGKAGNYVIPDGVSSIGDGAFAGGQLTSVTIPNSVTTIRDLAFQRCSGLTNITIPDSVTSLGWNAFEHCVGLANAMIGNGVTRIGEGAFYNCTNLANVTIGSRVTTIGGWAFRSCSSLTNATIPSSVTSIGDNAFGFTALPSQRVDPANPAYCSSPEGVVFDKQMRFLVSYPAGRSGSYVIPEGVTNMAAAAFLGSTRLTSVTVPGSVTGVGGWAFLGCTNLTSVYFKGNAPKLGEGVFAEIKKATVYYQPGATGWGKEFGGLPTAPWNPEGNNAASPAATGQTPFTWTTNNGAITLAWYTGSDVAVTIPRTINGLPVTRIGDRAFENWGNTSLASVTIPDSVTVIGSYAFAGRSSLTNVTIPNSVTNLGHWVFCGCNSLTAIRVPASITSMGWTPFWSCARLASITVDPANPAYSSSADGVLFNKEKTWIIDCPGGKTGHYVIPNGVTSIVASFAGCTNLTSITIPNSLTSIGERAFFMCSSLTNVTIPNSVTSISREAFLDCTALPGLAIPTSVTGIEDSALRNCRSLTSVTIPDGVTSIGGAAFAACGGLNAIKVDSANPAYSGSADGVLFNKQKTSLVAYPGGKAGNYEIPSGVTRIGPAAFKECPYVTSVTIPETVTDIGAEAFRKCENLTAVYFKGNAPRLGKDVFEDNSKLKIYYLSDKSGWGGEFGGRPTKVWSGQASSAAALMPPLPPVILPASRASLAALRGEFDWTVNNNAVTITKYKGQGGAVVIPSQVSGLPVTVIGDWSFRDCSALTSVTIPDSVTAIGWCVFHNCAGLTNASISKSVATINGNPFRYCTSLTAIGVDAANPAFTSVDGVVYDKAKTRLQCYPCGRRGDYRIPEGLATIGQGSFEGSDKVTGVTIPNSVTEIGPYSFLNCARLAHINIPEGVARISDKAFEGCASLSKLSLPKSLAQMDWNPFRACTNLVSVEVHADNPNFASKDGVLFDKAGTRLICYPGGRNGSYDVPKGVSVIGGGAFWGCVRLTAVTIPEGVTSLDYWAFYGCSRLASVTLPSSLTTIGDHAFMDCSSLASITIPDSVTTIADGAFASCLKLASIKFPNRTTRIAPWMCWNCPNLTAVTIPASVTSIGDTAFNSCSKLERITIPNSVTEIGNNAFAHCSKLAGIAIPDSVVKIGESAFWNCPNLATVTFGNRLVSVGRWCFWNCGLTQVTLPESVTTLGQNPFAHCVKLASISVKAGNSFFCSVDGMLFNKDKTYLIGYPGGKPGGYPVPAGVTKIGGQAFQGSKRLTSVTFPESLKAIEEYAFQWCDSLVGVKVQGDAPAVGADVFSGNNKATVGYLPGKKGWGKEFAGRPVCPMSGDFAYAEENNTMTIVRYLGAGGAVTIPDRINGIPVATIGGGAFSECIDVTSVTIPRGIMAIKDWAFNCCTRLAKASTGVWTFWKARLGRKGLGFIRRQPLGPWSGRLRGRCRWQRSLGGRPVAGARA